MNGLKVFVDPVPSSLSRAMHRVAAGLAAHAPQHVEIVSVPERADLQVLHAIDWDPRGNLKAPEYAIIQYCYQSTSAPWPSTWVQAWSEARAVWSYYDLSADMPDGTVFFHAPLFVDSAFAEPAATSQVRDIGVMTSGYVSGEKAEAIEEVAVAAERAGLSVFHLGPASVVGMDRQPSASWSAESGLSDAALAAMYGRCQWVSGLRHVEGFELPALEGLACGARPILFDRPETRQWYDGHAVFVPECHGDSLVEILTELFSGAPPQPPGPAERASVLAAFDRASIVRRFWEAVL